MFSDEFLWMLFLLWRDAPMMMYLALTGCKTCRRTFLYNKTFYLRRMPVSFGCFGFVSFWPFFLKTSAWTLVAIKLRLSTIFKMTRWLSCLLNSCLCSKSLCCFENIYPYMEIIFLCFILTFKCGRYLELGHRIKKTLE